MDNSQVDYYITRMQLNEWKLKLDVNKLEGRSFYRTTQIALSGPAIWLQVYRVLN